MTAQPFIETEVIMTASRCALVAALAFAALPSFAQDAPAPPADEAAFFRLTRFDHLGVSV